MTSGGWSYARYQPSNCETNAVVTTCESARNATVCSLGESRDQSKPVPLPSGIMNNGYYSTMIYELEVRLFDRARVSSRLAKASPLNSPASSSSTVLLRIELRRPRFRSGRGRYIIDWITIDTSKRSVPPLPRRYLGPYDERQYKAQYDKIRTVYFPG
jgi:hypothetical protein